MLLTVCGKRCYREQLVNELLGGARKVERRRFLLTCGHLVDWKWEYMEDRFVALTARVPVLIKYWDLEKLRPKLDKAAFDFYRNVDAALKLPNLVLALETFASLCYIVGVWSRWLQGCSCCPQQPRHHMTGKPCPWAGKRGCELVWGGLDRMLNSIRQYQSEQVKLLVAKQSKADGGYFVAELRGMGEYVANELEFKLKVMWLELLGKLWGLFGEAFGQSAGATNLFAKGLIDEYNRIADKEKVHRVARQFLDPASAVRRMLDHKIRDNARLEDMPELWMHIAAYAFAPLCNKKNEGDHRTIKCESRAALTRVLPPFLCAKLRRKDILQHCDDPAFLAFAQKMWNKRGTAELAAHLLRGEIPTCDLVRMTWRNKLRRIYQFGLCEQFKDTAEIDKRLVAFRAFVKQRFLETPPPLPATSIMIAQCLKDLLRPGRIYSLPERLFNVADKTDGSMCVPHDFSLRPLLLELPKPNHIVLDGLLVFFEVMNARPERLVRAMPSHIPASRTMVRVRMYTLQTASGHTAAISPAAHGQQEVDISAWSFPQTFLAFLSNLVCWAVVRQGVVADAKVAVDDRAAMAIVDRAPADSEVVVVVAAPAAGDWVLDETRFVDHLLRAGALSTSAPAQWVDFNQLSGVHTAVACAPTRHCGATGGPGCSRPLQCLACHPCHLSFFALTLGKFCSGGTLICPAHIAESVDRHGDVAGEGGLGCGGGWSGGTRGQGHHNCVSHSRSRACSRDRPARLCSAWSTAAWSRSGSTNSTRARSRFAWTGSPSRRSRRSLSKGWSST